MNATTQRLVHRLTTVKSKTQIVSQTPLRLSYFTLPFPSTYLRYAFWGNKPHNYQSRQSFPQPQNLTQITPIQQFPKLTTLTEVHITQPSTCQKFKKSKIQKSKIEHVGLHASSAFSLNPKARSLDLYGHEVGVCHWKVKVMA